MGGPAPFWSRPSIARPARLGSSPRPGAWMASSYGWSRSIPAPKRIWMPTPSAPPASTRTSGWWKSRTPTAGDSSPKRWNGTADRRTLTPRRGLRQGAESFDHLPIGLAFEVNDRIQRFVDGRPTPGVELYLRVAAQVEFAVLADEAQGEPHLLLAEPSL